MALHPDKQAKAQTEVDSVIGCDIVRIQDRARLPYMRALIQEVMRWRVVTPLSTLSLSPLLSASLNQHSYVPLITALGIACQAQEPDTYKGMLARLRTLSIVSHVLRTTTTLIGLE